MSQPEEITFRWPHPVIQGAAKRTTNWTTDSLNPNINNGPPGAVYTKEEKTDALLANCYVPIKARKVYDWITSLPPHEEMSDPYYPQREVSKVSRDDLSRLKEINVDLGASVVEGYHRRYEGGKPTYTIQKRGEVGPGGLEEYRQSNELNQYEKAEVQKAAVGERYRRYRNNGRHWNDPQVPRMQGFDRWELPTGQDPQPVQVPKNTKGGWMEQAEPLVLATKKPGECEKRFDQCPEKPEPTLRQEEVKGLPPHLRAILKGKMHTVDQQQQVEEQEASEQISKLQITPKNNSDTDLKTVANSNLPKFSAKPVPKWKAGFKKTIDETKALKSKSESD